MFPIYVCFQIKVMFPNDNVSNVCFQYRALLTGVTDEVEVKLEILNSILRGFSASFDPDFAKNYNLSSKK